MIPSLGTLRGAESRATDASVKSAIEALSPAQAEVVSRLRDAALHLFQRFGFDGTTTDEIAQRAHVSRRTLFQYFPTKEDVLFADHAAFLARVSDALADNDPDPMACTKRALMSLLGCYFEDVESTRRLAKLVETTPALRDREVLWLHEYQERIGDFLARRGPVDAALARIVAAALLASFREVLIGWVANGDELRARATLAELLDEVVDALTRKGPRATTPPYALVS